MTGDDTIPHNLEDLLKDSLHALESIELDSHAAKDSSNADPTDNGAGKSAPHVEKARQPDKKKEMPKQDAPKKPATEDGASFFDRLSDMTGSAFRFAKRTTGTSLKVGRALMNSQDQLKLMLAAGSSLRDLREVAGLTLSELNDALSLKDQTLLEAVENGTATLSFELILRLAAVLARNDPLPFIIRYTRTYSPETWRMLTDWGIGRLPLHFERERKFINIYRSQDVARSLSDEGFEKVLQLTRGAFEMSLHFVAEQEERLEAMKAQWLAEQEERLSQAVRDSSGVRKNRPDKNKEDRKR